MHEAQQTDGEEESTGRVLSGVGGWAACLGLIVLVVLRYSGWVWLLTCIEGIRQE